MKDNGFRLNLKRPISRNTHYWMTDEQAEELKCEHGIAKEALATDENNIIIKGTNATEDIQISQKELAGIIEARMTEIFHLTKSEIKKFDYEKKLNFGVVITGGGSQLNNIEDLARELFELEIKIGRPNSVNGINDIIDNPRYSTVIGLIKYISENNEILITKDKENLDLIEIIKKLS